MAEQQADPRPVIIEYRTPDARFGQRFGVASVHDALTVHPDAEIVAYADGQLFEGKEAKVEVREAKAEIREERAAEREQAQAEVTVIIESPPDAAPAPVSATDASPPPEPPRTRGRA